MSSNKKSKARPRVAVIGGGIFGVTAALVLAPRCRVEIFERASALLTGATFANHGRQHFGFHYPRSLETARQCLDSHDDFRSLYSDAEIMDFPNYYCIARNKSKVDANQYLEFCDQAGLQYNRESPPDGAVETDKIALSLRVTEGVLDYSALKQAALSKLQNEGSVGVHLDCEVIAGKVLERGVKELAIAAANETRREHFDFVINATYAHYNTFCGWFGFEPRLFQFNLQELSVVELPSAVRLGITIMDGVFPSIIPMGRTPYHLLAHVDASQLMRESSRRARPLLNRASAIESNWAGILEASAEYLPFLRRARYVRSLYVDRVVDANARLTDARLTDINDHGQGCFSIFAAKVITCVSTAHKLAEMIAPL